MQVLDFDMIWAAIVAFFMILGGASLTKGDHEFGLMCFIMATIIAGTLTLLRELDGLRHDRYEEPEDKGQLRG